MLKMFLHRMFFLSESEDSEQTDGVLEREGVGERETTGDTLEGETCGVDILGAETCGAVTIGVLISLLL